MPRGSALPAGREHRASDPFRSREGLPRPPLGAGVAVRRRPALKARIREVADSSSASPPNGSFAKARCSNRPSTCGRRFPHGGSLRGDRGPAPRAIEDAAGGPHPRARRWTGSSAAMSALIRPRWRCARPSSRPLSGLQVAVIAPTTLLARTAREVLRRAVPGAFGWKCVSSRVSSARRRRQATREGSRKGRRLSSSAPTASARQTGEVYTTSGCSYIDEEAAISASPYKERSD